ncbi:hypothetical protein TraAM80_09403 [Trypanosoma rangeli]|uniref:Transmembrane protein n=1 Tax=Trypanosoma rangeli TaxID=5698 RepID=A0A3R7M0Y6_TRYRA|nr:uncharacterized protein TraAM80_09403 [Trypanosoma rangeli]RNE97324.1 hypothetical protein TraAM80_09403 [Trypanosoma rangeli]|eukprot:RNE97324.1 hypothetical protein TraAM80_09403 [Trypanosoma rangeli]
MHERAPSIALSLLFSVAVSLTMVLVILCMKLNRRLTLERQRRRVQRRELLQLTQNMQEQEVWRREHLFRVVSILLSRGEVHRGIPLVMHLPGHGNRLVESNVRGLRSQLLRQMDGTLASIPNIVMRAQASDTLSPEALPGHDLRQLVVLWLTRQRASAETDAEHSSSSLSAPASSSTAETLPGPETVYGVCVPYLPRSCLDGDMMIDILDEGHNSDGNPRGSDGVVPGPHTQQLLSFEEVTPVHWIGEVSSTTSVTFIS